MDRKETGDPGWHWTVTGTQTAASPGGMRRDDTQSGVIHAESAPEALIELLHHGPVWDWLDSSAPFTVAMRPATAEDVAPRRLTEIEAEQELWKRLHLINAGKAVQAARGRGHYQGRLFRVEFHADPDGWHGGGWYTVQIDGEWVTGPA